MRVICGLGNPGSRYKNSRHNIGFILLDYLAEKHNLMFISDKNYFYAKGELHNSPFIFIKPLTYMNNSGVAVKEVLQDYNVSPENFLAVYDDIHLPMGQIRIRQQGGDGGHNGLSSIIYHLETDKFPRLRVGIGIEDKIDSLPDFVLDKFTVSEKKTLEPALTLGGELIEHFSEAGIKAMLDHYSHSMLPKKDNR